VKKRNIDWLDGMLSAVPMTKEVKVFRTMRLKILLGKWLFKLLMEDGTWQTILKRKYVGSWRFGKMVF
jgi:hypothetical protein